MRLKKLKDLSMKNLETRPCQFVQKWMWKEELRWLRIRISAHFWQVKSNRPLVIDVLKDSPSLIFLERVAHPSYGLELGTRMGNILLLSNSLSLTASMTPLQIERYLFAKRYLEKTDQLLTSSPVL